MCGITGFFHRQKIENERWIRTVLSQMTSSLKHRGPDSSDIWCDAKPQIGLGHTRLAIQDLSPAGSQPMPSASGRFVLTFNGEIYNFQELRTELEQAGCKFRGHSDTEVLLTAIEEWGVTQALQRANGMFAFAIWDSITRTLTLARDRIGKKPLYYGWSGKTFLFASELKALKHHPDFDATIDPGALALYMQYSWIPTPSSIYQSIKKLPPGCFLSISPDSIPWTLEPQHYWSSQQVARHAEHHAFSGTFEEAQEELSNILQQAVRQRMIADVELGALLSGGIDSTTVVALMQLASTRPVKTFSIGFWEEKYNEAPFAKAVAAQLGTDHTEYYLTPKDVQSIIPDLPGIYDEPFADSSQIPTLAISRITGQRVKVALSGDGGDELFAGYSRYQECLQRWNQWKQVPLPARQCSATLMEQAAKIAWLGKEHCRPGSSPALNSKNSSWAKLEKKSRWLPASTPVELMARRYNRYPNVQDLLPNAPRTATFLNTPNMWPALKDPIHGMRFLDFSTYLPDDILVKVDRASMSVSLEIRCPLLDYRLVEFAWSLPASMCVSPQKTGKYILKQVLQKHVPPQYFERPKQGFALPVSEWLRDSLRDWAEDLLEETRLDQQGFFDPKLVHRIWRQHLSGWQDHDTLIWSILMFQSWLNNKP
ncbi:MAG: asparagine synthase (glutamine-hydrolyzing) [Nitrospirales bacterium]|nr:asparagine synthase (glutamine-hydrolyzing) [Nitrospirales bacterium]